MNFLSEGYFDFDIVLMFYQLWRGIANAFIDFIETLMNVFKKDEDTPTQGA